ncbi:MAG: glycerate kinase [Planctomycetota bacterium]|jgi:glycerate kinase
MRCLIANDKFKGSLSALEAAKAIAAGLPSGTVVDLCPIADGGDGFTETMLAALEGRRVQATVSDALGRPIVATYGVTAGGLAVLEMAAASGLVAITPGDRSILRSSTFGTGELIRDAANQPDVRRIVIGLGGSATNDGGVGMASALGFQPQDGQGRPLDPWPGAWNDLAGFRPSEAPLLPNISVASDVTNPLLGPNGATAVFAKQKGATATEREQLERALRRLVQVTGAMEVANRPGAGAAGGLGFGLMHFLDAALHSGFELVAETLHLEQRIEQADIVITGEGSMDAQSLDGKGPIGVARMAAKANRPVYALAGRITAEVRATNLFHATQGLDESGLRMADLMQNAAQLLTEATRRLIPT